MTRTFGKKAYFWMLIVLGIFPSISKADISISAYAGYAPLAQIKKERVDLPLSLFPITGELAYAYEVSESFALGAGLSSLHARVLYTEVETAYAGVLNAHALAAFFEIAVGTYSLRLQGESYLNSTLSVRSEIHSRINDGIFKHSTLLQYKGENGVLARCALIKELSDGQFARFTRMRIGLSLDAMQLPLSRESIDINTNDPVISPGEKTQNTVAYSLEYYSLSFLIGMVF